MRQGHRWDRREREEGAWGGHGQIRGLDERIVSWVWIVVDADGSKATNRGNTKRTHKTTRRRRQASAAGEAGQHGRRDAAGKVEGQWRWRHAVGTKARRSAGAGAEMGGSRPDGTGGTWRAPVRTSAAKSVCIVVHKGRTSTKAATTTKARLGSCVSRLILGKHRVGVGLALGGIGGGDGVDDGLGLFMADFCWGRRGRG